LKRTLILHPFIVAVFPALALYTYNVQELSLSELVLPFRGGTIPGLADAAVHLAGVAKHP